MHSSMDVPTQLPMKVLITEIYTNSSFETSSQDNGHHRSQIRNLDESLDVKMVQESLLVSKSTEGEVDEVLAENALATMECNSTWGDFEVFSEVKVENVSIQESLETHANGIDTSNQFATSWTQTAGHDRRQAFANDTTKAVVCSEDIIKQSFQEVPVPPFLEKIKSLEHLLGIKTEEADIPECMKQQLSSASTNLWETLTCSSNPSSLRWPWNESHHQENLLAVLGIDPHQKVLSEGKENILEKTNIRENEESSVDKCGISKSLIQTKLSADPNQNHLFRYNLFLKKNSPTGNMQYITVPQKKIFTTQNLRMKMFNSNIC